MAVRGPGEKLLREKSFRLEIFLVSLAAILLEIGSHEHVPWEIRAHVA